MSYAEIVEAVKGLNEEEARQIRALLDEMEQQWQIEHRREQLQKTLTDFRAKNKMQFNENEVDAWIYWLRNDEDDSKLNFPKNHASNGH
jgi:NifU-like protein involved in Fe-S cluster formation